MRLHRAKSAAVAKRFKAVLVRSGAPYGTLMYDRASQT
jgi:hypothetical protein